MLNSYTLAARKRTLRWFRPCASVGESVSGESDIGMADEKKPENRLVGDEFSSVFRCTTGGYGESETGLSSAVGGYVDSDVGRLRAGGLGEPDGGRVANVGASLARLVLDVSKLGRGTEVGSVVVRLMVVIGRAALEIEPLLLKYDR